VKVLLYADGGVGIGLGHAARCAALTAELIKSGHSALVAIDDNAGLERYLATQNCPFILVSASGETLLNLALETQADIVVVDSYRWGIAEFTRLRSNCVVVAFDDEGFRQLPVDAVINGAPSAAQIAYKVSEETELWLGPRFQVVREGFTTLPKKDRFTPLRRVICLVGGDDSLGLLPLLAYLLERSASKLKFKITVELVCGPYVKVPSIKQSECVRILVDPADLPQRMAEADLAVSAAGQTLYELARCGTPTIAFSTGRDQERNLSDLANTGFLVSTGDASQTEWPEKLEAAFGTVANNDLLRAYMSKIGQTLIDGFGSSRLVEAITLLSARHKRG
jgi:spore coat polysaccharide biosynthesis predicted glycosyltransferase SpsG